MRIDMAWQWDNNLLSVYLGAFCMAAEEANISRTEFPRYLTPPFSAVTISEPLPVTKVTGVVIVKGGQAHNPPVASAYETAAKSDQVRFWNLVLSSSHIGADLDACSLGMRWQAANNINS